MLFARAFAAGAAPAAENATLREEGLPLVERIRPEDYRGFGLVTAVTVLPNGVLAFASTAAVYLYDRTEFTRVPVPSAYATALLSAGPGRLWVGGDGVIGVIESDPTTGGARFVSQLDRLPPGTGEVGSIRSLALGGDGAVLAVSERGLARFAADGTAQWWTLAADNYPCLAVIDGHILHASDPSGLSILEGGKVRNIVRADALPRRLTDILPGPAGHVHLLTFDGGMVDCDLATGQVTPFATPLDAFLRNHPAGSILPLQDGRCAMILAKGGLLLAEADWSGARILSTAEGLGSSNIYSIAADHEDGLWLATSNGLTRFQVGRGVSVFDERSGFTANGVFGLARHEGTFYASSVEGLLRLVPSDPATGAPARFAPDPRFPGLVNVLLSDQQGLLLGTSLGVTLLPHAGVARELLATSTSVQGLMASSHDPTVSFAFTERGLYVLRRTADGFSSSGALQSDIAFWSGAEEPDGTLWCGTRSSGIVRISPPADGDWNHAKLTVFRPGTAGLPATRGWTGAYRAFGEIQLLADDGTHRWDAASQSLPLDRRLTLDDRHDVRSLPVVTDAQGRAWTSPWLGVNACSRPLGWFDAARGWHDAPPVASAAVGFFGAGRMLIEGGASEILWARGNGSLVRLDLGALHDAPAPATWQPVLRGVRAAGRPWPVETATPPAFPFTRESIVFHFAAPRFAPGAAVRFRTRLLGFDPVWSDPDAAFEREYTNLSGGPFTLEIQALDAGGHESAVTRYTFSVTPPWHRRPLAYALYLLAALGIMAAFLRWRLSRAAREHRRLEALVATRTRDLAIARDAAESASRAKSAFLASMSHELRTPLNGVLGYAQLLQADKRLAPDQQERLRIVHQSGEHLLHMINDVLDLAKIEAGKLTLRPAPFALGDLLRDIAAAHAPAAAAKGLAFSLESAPDLPAWVEADAQKLRQILDNLIGNAIKFTARGSVTLRVAAADPGSSLLAFSVTDTGPGISAADQSRLFQAFEQAGADHAGPAGTGLGLAISRALVERFGGTLTLASEPGRGSTFAFTLALPAVKPGEAATTAGRRIVGYAGRPLRALLVDDHAINRRLLADLLAPLGFDCAEYASPAALLTRLKQGAEPWPDVAIVDLRMPDIDGLELTRRLRAFPRGPELKILLTSASVIAFDPAEATRAGCDDFLPKPFRTADLLEKLGRLLGLAWRESDSVAPFPAAPGAPLPAAARAALRECLATGDLEAFAAELARQRELHPDATARLDELAAAAASFKLAHHPPQLV